MHPVWRGLLDVLYPPRCEACGELRREPVCGSCQAAIEFIRPPLCELCGMPFDPQARGGPRCAGCRGRRPALSAARSAAYYAEPLATAIHRFKYHCQMVLWRPLGALMVEALAAGSAAPIEAAVVDVVCAVPLHAQRLRERGFNQSELLAEAVAGSLGRPLDRLLERTRPTLPQVDLPAGSRAANVSGAFAATMQAPIAGRRVLLIDDLYTTGATMGECARVLRRAGALAVCAFTLARPAPRWRWAETDRR